MVNRPTLAVVHWLPAEMYPPTMNLVRYFADSGRWQVALHTSANHRNLPDFRHSGVAIHRSPAPGRRRAGRRAWAYLMFHLGTALRLIVARPDVVLYVEPQSAFPVFLASFSRRRFPLFIHHHEYHDPEQFLRPGMRLPRLFHRLERSRLFQRADWISHTNEKRLELFLRDHPDVDPALGRILPNYPPASWFGFPNHAWAGEAPAPLRMVYVGSLSRKDTYIEEIVSWLREQPAQSVTLDIFAYNLHQETHDFLKANEGRGVRFFSEGITYDALPNTLREYHTGLLLYKANTTNYQYNATNKLFEYLACGLDVLFPTQMLGVKPYARQDVAPRVMEVDFERRAGLDLSILADRRTLPEAAWLSDASSVLKDLEEAMLKKLSDH